MLDPRLLLPWVMAALAWTVANAGQDVPWPRCSERLDGQSLCGNGSVCACHYDPGGSVTGRVAAWRWSCDILQMCGDPPPAGLPPQASPQAVIGLSPPPPLAPPR